MITNSRVQAGRRTTLSDETIGIAESREGFLTLQQTACAFASAEAMRQVTFASDAKAMLRTNLANGQAANDAGHFA